MKKQDKFAKIHEIVDQIFTICNVADEDLEAKPDGNTIILTAANRYDDCLHASPADEPFDVIDWGHFGHRYNSLYFPINEDIKCHPKAHDLYIQLKHEVASLGIPYAEDYWHNSDAINEVWYGCIGIMQDYKVVAFIIRKDGIVLNESSIDDTSIYEKHHISKEYYNHIITEF